MMNRYDAYTAMLGRHRSVIWAMCWAHARGRWDDCCDLVQEVSIALWENYGKLRPSVSFKEERAWVRWQARSVFDQIQRRRQVETTPLTDRLADTLVDEDSRQVKEDMEELMASLSPDEQRLVRLQMEGYNADEIASVMGLKRDAVYQRMHRIIVKARRVLAVVMLLFSVSTVAIAVVPQWRQTVFGSEGPKGDKETADKEAGDKEIRRQETRRQEAGEKAEQDSIAISVWTPPEPVPYLEGISTASDTGVPPMPKVHRSQPVVIMSAHRLIVSGAEGELVRIYNQSTGELLAVQRSDGLCYFNFSPGDYIIQIGEGPEGRYRLSL